MLEVQGLSKRYGRRTVLRGVSFSLQEGRILGILGENGSGKSTLLKIVAGVTPATAGRVLLDGEEVGTRTRAKTAYLPEVNPYYGWMRVREQLGFLSAFYAGWDMAKANGLLEFMGLDPESRIAELSLGQRARLKTVAGFSWPSAVVVLDEPFGGIDPPARRRILQSLIREFRSGEQTIVISTHLVDEVEEIIEQVLFLRQGEVAIQGTADELRAARGQSLSGMFEEVVS
ncbi:MAG: ABC transporter ATP-binding protein [Candidatus Latescibacterota bacterium]